MNLFVAEDVYESLRDWKHRRWDRIPSELKVDEKTVVKGVVILSITPTEIIDFSKDNLGDGVVNLGDSTIQVSVKTLLKKGE